MINSIALPTDFSDAGTTAFEHALRLAMLNRSRLDLLHVRHPEEPPRWQAFPRVREVLHRWNYLAEDAPVEDILATTGVEVRKVDIRDGDAGDGLSNYLHEHRPDLLVMASRGHAGLERWLKGSVSAEILRETLVPTLVLGPEARPFVASDSGVMEVGIVLVPVDHRPSPNGAIAKLQSLTSALEVTFDFVHVGTDAPRVEDGNGAPLPVRTVEGSVVEALVLEADSVNLIAMPTEGRNGFLDAIRGSTTERLISEVGCPVLVLPVSK
ncbi:universal stress protein [Croceibacterium sp. LX-88]|uniref:Universal stress protein n=1 Tax=Croceibacterium selenioxidans TaxID=2838833 RepID=A0ABS5W110_9SPHN|nr:universal stress protein [Croceibacterium selenioxidans]MBT2132997.1 universal stress protein [Croceibacterium selenioxidans]